MRQIALVIAWGFVGLVGDAAARQTPASSIPADVRALLVAGRSGAGTLEILTAAPESFPRDLLPEGATVVAAAAANGVTSVVAALDGASPLVETRYHWRLADAGWINPRPRMLGFSPGEMMNRPMVVCRGSDFAEVTTRARSAGGTLIGIALTKEIQRTCVATGTRPFSDVPLPLFVAPVGTLMSGMGGGGGVDDLYTKTRLETSLAVDALTSHFLDQLKASGWKIEGTTLTDRVLSATRVSAVSKNGDSITGLLTLTQIVGTNSVDAMFRVVRHKPVIR